tara:strand:+ start:501 stop:767 length:267 start_codon:yes stop_codon:yes gene_type:complete
MKTAGLKVVNGKYVVPRGGISDWVYDVYVELDGQLVAVVGFTERQTKGALFWQVDNDKILDICSNKGNRIEEEIRELARKYFENDTTI